MMIPLLTASTLLLAATAIHGLGLFALARLLRSERAEERIERIPPLSLRAGGFTVAVVLALIALHGVEIWMFALFYLAVGAMPTLENAVYFSTITYATIGYDDQGIGLTWRLVAAIEGIGGIILLGWSTAFFIRLLSRFDLH